MISFFQLIFYCNDLERSKSVLKKFKKAESTENVLILMSLDKKKKHKNTKIFIITNDADQSVEFIEHIHDEHNCSQDILVFLVVATFNTARNYYNIL